MKIVMYKKTIAVLVFVLLISLISLSGRYFYRNAKYREIIAGIMIESPDLSKISNGVYDGSFDAIMNAADVSVTIHDHRITDIKINNHKTVKGQQAVRITDEVLSAQSLDVDTVTGATKSSLVILKAIENAIEKGYGNQ